MKEEAETQKSEKTSGLQPHNGQNCKIGHIWQLVGRDENNALLFMPKGYGVVSTEDMYDMGSRKIS